MPTLKYRDPADGIWKYVGVSAGVQTLLDNAVWNLPRGIVAKGTLNITSGVTRVVPNSTYSAASDIGSVSFTLVAGRRYKLRYFVRACDAKGCNLFLWVDGVVSSVVTDPWMRVEGTWNSFGLDYLFDTSMIAAGAHTFLLRVSNQSGVTATFYTDSASYLVLEDMGPINPGALPPTPPTTGVTSPAWAGPRSDNANDARFGHVSQLGNVGYIADSGGSNYIINAFGGNLGVYMKDVGGGYTPRLQVDDGNVYSYVAFTVKGSMAVVQAEFRDDPTRKWGHYATGGLTRLWDSTYGDMLQINGSRLIMPSKIAIGDHPVHAGYDGIWRDGASANGYALIQDGSYNTLLNGASSLSIRIGNGSDLMLFNTVIASQMRHYMNSFLYANYNAGSTVDWGNAPIQTSSSGNTMPRISLWCPNVAPQLRCNVAYGDHLEVINNPGSAYANIRAAAFPVASSLAFKEDVRPIRIRDLPPALNDRWDDKVGSLDIMALRPVAFRPKVGALEILPTDKDKPIDGADSDTWFNKERDHSTWLGHQGHRERLGLIAEEVENVLPSAVDHYEDGTHGAIDYAQIVVAMLDHVQRLTDEVSTLRYRIAELENA